MSYFPFFIDLENQKGLIVGGGRIAAEKVEKLLPFGPRLTLIAPKIQDELSANAALDCLFRKFRDEDVDGMLFVVAATNDEKLNGHISDLCRQKGILVNVVDDKEKCGFLFPSLVQEGDLTIGVSTAGASPQVAVTLRKRIEKMIGPRMGEILIYLRELRPIAKEQIKDGKKRRTFFIEAADKCLALDRALDETETEKLLESFR